MIRVRNWPLNAVAIVALGGCYPTTHAYRYPSRDQDVVLTVEPERRQAAAEGRVNAVDLLGAAPPAKSDEEAPPGERIRLGSFTGLWNPAAIAWIDETTVNVCPLEGDRTVPKSVSILVTETTRRTYWITTDCPAFLRRGAARP